MKRTLLVALVLLTAGCGTPLTAKRMTPSFAEVFSGLYVKQQQTLGRTDVDREGLFTQASCARSGTQSDGPGDDWVCTVSFQEGSVTLSQTFDVQLKPDGCWMADGAPGVQHAQILDAARRRPVTNPLAQFDGCLDTSWAALGR